MVKEDLNTNKTNEKYRRWTIQRSYYYDVHDENQELKSDMTEKEWKKQIKAEMTDIISKGQAKSIRGMFHDKDIDDDGKPKALHFHAVVNMKNQCRKNSIMKLFGVSAEYNVDNVHNLVQATKYLMHLTSAALKDGKFIYGQRELIEFGDFSDQEELHVLLGDESIAGVHYTGAESFIAEVSAEVTTKGLTKTEVKQKLLDDTKGDIIKRQKQWNKYRSNYKTDIGEYIEDKAEKLSMDGRDMQTLYITAPGGKGKSQLSQEIARAINPNRAPFKAAGVGKGKTFDFTDGYLAQPVGILDDIIGSNFELGEFLQSFDPYIFSLTSSRKENSYYLADYTIMNSSIPLNDFASQIMAYSKGGSGFLRNHYQGQERRPERDTQTPNDAFAGLRGVPRLNALPATKDRLFQVMRRIKFYVQIHDNKVDMYRFVDLGDSNYWYYKIMSNEELGHIRKGKANKMSEVAQKIVALMNEYSDDSDELEKLAMAQYKAREPKLSANYTMSDYFNEIPGTESQYTDELVTGRDE